MKAFLLEVLYALLVAVGCVGIAYAFLMILAMIAMAKYG